MTAYTYTYERTVFLRKRDGMDSEIAGSEVQTTTTTVVVPDESIYWNNVAFGYVRDNHAGNSYDPTFRLISVTKLRIDVLLHETKRL